VKGIGRRAPPLLATYKQSRALESLVTYSLSWRPRSACPWRAPIMVAPCSSPRVPPRLAPLPGTRCENRFPDGLFVKKVF
jgi:hypothetical protein